MDVVSPFNEAGFRTEGQLTEKVWRAHLVHVRPFPLEEKTEDSDGRNHAKSNIGFEQGMPGATNHNEDTKPKCLTAAFADSDQTDASSEGHYPSRSNGTCSGSRYPRVPLPSRLP
jgi:hypothetical protein